MLEQIKRDHEGKTKDFRAELEAVNVLIGMEHRRHDGCTARASARSAAARHPQPLKREQRRARCPAS